ncbi:Hypothetical protein CINCED_3A018018 [Cinara cedri]|nr:Hypothetical protein CINCED_3A018018 [Cinara cedri]
MSIRVGIARLLVNVAVGCCSAALTYVMYTYFNKEQNEVLFFYGNNSTSCSSSNSDNTINALNHCNCMDCNVLKIISWIDGAKKTLDICLYVFNHEMLLKAVINAHKRGVCVRLILNEDNSRLTWNLGCIGIPKRVKNPELNSNLMHHKFTIIDNKRIILGSLNWSQNATRSNWENIFITNECEIVNTFKQEFQRLWLEFND